MKKKKAEEEGSSKQLDPRRARIVLISPAHIAHLFPPRLLRVPMLPRSSRQSYAQLSVDIIGRLAPLDPSAEYEVLV
ncbi:hypothetical protein SVAN01_03895 [Stagonosporopsis vannaccii]|nr:hypothetical protein SVAN01_03895 [Stagonosporopsis vannaccii]